MLLLVSLKESLPPSLTFVDGSQNGRVTDDVLPPRLIAAMRRSIGPRLGQSALLSSFMKYRLVFVASVGKELDSLPRALARSEHVCSLSDVPSYNFTNWVREKKNDGQTDLLLPSIAVSPFLATAVLQERGERGRMYRSTGGMAGKYVRKPGRQAVGLINTLATSASGPGAFWSFFDQGFFV